MKAMRQWRRFAIARWLARFGRNPVSGAHGREPGDRASIFPESLPESRPKSRPECLPDSSPASAREFPPALPPDFLILGAQKSGTTSLYQMLLQHPQIVPAATKEVHFFDLQFDRGLDWYRAQFPPRSPAKNAPGISKHSPETERLEFASKSNSGNDFEHSAKNPTRDNFEKEHFEKASGNSSENSFEGISEKISGKSSGKISEGISEIFEISEEISGDSNAASDVPLETLRERAELPLLTGEASPYYLFHPAVPDRVRACCPQAKLIVLLREPGDRALSQYHHEIRHGFETLPLDEALDREAERLAGEADRLRADPSYPSFSYQHHSYLARGRYAEQLAAWRSQFPAEQILVLQSEAFYRDPRSTLDRVAAFLNLPPHPFRAEGKHNAGRYDPPPAALRRRLDDYFRPHNARLKADLARHWPEALRADFGSGWLNS